MPWLIALAGLVIAAPTESEKGVVLLGRRTAASPALARGVVDDAARHLATLGVPQELAPDAALKQLARLAVKDTASCNGKRACLAELGRQLKAPWVIAVSVASIDAELSIGLELLRVADEAVVETDSLLLPKKARLEPTHLQAFAAKVAARLAPPAPVTPPDAPVVTRLEPTPPPPVEPLLPPPPPPPERSHTTSFVLGGVGLAALVAGGTVLALGVAGRAPLTAGQPGDDLRVRSTLSASEADALNTRTNALIIGGVGGLVLGAGLGTAGVLTW